MRTTITIDEHLLAQVRQRAATTGRTVSQTIEDAVRDSLMRRSQGGVRRRIELPTFNSGGYQEGVDLDSNVALLDIMESVE